MKGERLELGLGEGVAWWGGGGGEKEKNVHAV